MTRSQTILAILTTAFTAFVLGASFADKPKPQPEPPPKLINPFREAGNVRTSHLVNPFREPRYVPPPTDAISAHDLQDQIERNRERRLREREVRALENIANAQERANYR